MRVRSASPQAYPGHGNLDRHAPSGEEERGKAERVQDGVDADKDRQPHLAGDELLPEPCPYFLGT